MLSRSLPSLGKVLVVAEAQNGKILPATLAAVTAGAKIGPVSALVAGKSGAQVAAALAKVKGIAEVLVAQGDHYDNGLPEEYAPLVAAVAKNGYTHVFAATSAFGKNVIPRAAAKEDTMPISEVTEVKDESTFVRHMYAGNVVSTVKSLDKVKYATIRGTSFDRAPLEGGSATTVNVDATPAVGKSKWIEDLVATSDKPDLLTAANVIVGGRGLKNGENFKLLYDLAEPLKAAVGATRAVVDAGFCANEMQIGQTGKTVAPNFYLGCGVSGAIQHVAGMKDSKVIAVINNDADAPFFQVADYGLVEDLFTAVPKLTDMVKK
ncbi:putative electron-transfer-flavoprotein, alpha polypeptide [Trypanosoma grayi]|uniref:putative electron-transfer-flavoprotein, alpha polypeptide n=1 Tax=Trypanosoma grayi TaxID=71804 RepID=UPI0004F45562|nr:putative electron-transfer-flavoprotein, alpha polypeptide [Trypanosoma grayi]KEG14555.1 putative electron-transfer-flavoprotein, alpha polypeptide [Trypanosoma grayi]